MYFHLILRCYAALPNACNYLTTNILLLRSFLSGIAAQTFVVNQGDHKYKPRRGEIFDNALRKAMFKPYILSILDARIKSFSDNPFIE